MDPMGFPHVFRDYVSFREGTILAVESIWIEEKAPGFARPKGCRLETIYLSLLAEKYRLTSDNQWPHHQRFP